MRLLRFLMLKAVLKEGCFHPCCGIWAVDSLLTQISSTGTHIQGYADDIVILVRGKFPEVVADLMNERLKDVCSWCSGNGLSVNSLKTTILLFTRIRNLTSLSRVNMNGVRVENAGTAKFLGVSLDQRLTWNPHLDNVLHGAKWALLTSRRFIGSKWRLKPHMAM
uniref:Reverse transcriptase domain-containing protein n=1 Tax=Cuerna arida TaxID=1464854 RepID=A0A1B6GC00_9HEMI